MIRYYVNKNKQDNGDNEVHTGDCQFLPIESNRHDLGLHDSCVSAVREAKRLGYSRANGCYFCSRQCHTS